jgi:DNA-binding MarR family transcriptional regulator
MATRARLPKVMSEESMKGLSEWHSLYQAYNAVFKVQEIALIPQGISLPQLHLLALLAYERRPLAVSELAAWMVKEPNSLTGLVDRTEAKGWVHTHGDPKDRRKRLVEFTDKGIKKFEEAFAVANDASSALFRTLGTREMDQLKGSCNKLRDAAVKELLKKPMFKVRAL